MAHIFISYSKADRDFVVYLRTLLETQGFDVWFDDELTPGDGWWNVITQNIDTAGAVIVVMSGNSLGSKWVEREILFAENNDKPIFPVLLSGEVWSRLADIQYEDLRAGLRAKLSKRFLKSMKSVIQPVRKGGRAIDFRIVRHSIQAYPSDVAVYKYAQSFHGADGKAANVLAAHNIIDMEAIAPDEGDYKLVDLRGKDTGGQLLSDQLLFIGMPVLKEITYPHLRDLGRLALAVPAQVTPDAKHISMTIHGPGFGMDENEALTSQFAGIMDALEAGDYPTALERVTIVEFSQKRTQRLQLTMDEVLKDSVYAEKNIRGDWGYRLHTGAIHSSKQSLFNAGKTQKRIAYVALPTETNMEDLFFYGIQTPVHALGLLCERYESAVETGDALAQVKARIDGATVFIADVSEPDPLVMLQIGYAWGCKRPVVLISRENAHGLFDDTPCLNYNSIRDLESVLFSALQNIIES